MFEFYPLKEKDIEMVGKWRTQPQVSKWMFTDFDYSLDAQRKWFAQIKDNPTRRYWVVHYQKPIGVVCLNQIHPINRWAHYEFYIGDLEYKQLGGILCGTFYNHVFTNTKLNINKLIAEVIGHNVNVRQLHRYYGYREVGWLCDHILKNGTWNDVVLYELLRDDWLENSTKFGNMRGTWYE